MTQKFILLLMSDEVTIWSLYGMTSLLRTTVFP